MGRGIPWCHAVLLRDFGEEVDANRVDDEITRNMSLDRSVSSF